MVQRYTLVRRARHGKRLPQVDSDDAEHISRPVTVTVTEVRLPVSSQVPASVVTPTITVFVPPSTSTSPLSTLVPTSDTVAVPPSSSLVPKPTPSIIVNNGASNNGGVNNVQDKPEQSGTTSSSSTPTGAIVGIVLAVVLLFSAALIFWFRRRAVANRLKTRGWATNNNVTTSKISEPSFLWVEPPKEKRGVSPSPSRVTELQPNRGPPQQPPMAYGPSWNGLPYIPPPIPPAPPRAAGLYDYPNSPSSVAPAAANVPRSLTPAVGASPPAVKRVPVPVPPPLPTAASSVPSTPGTGKPFESAKVVTGFIPTLSDELLVTPGEFMRIHEEFDDGWTLCSNVRGEMGMVPLECLDRMGMTPNTRREFRKLARVSSLHPKSYASYQ